MKIITAAFATLAILTSSALSAAALLSPTPFPDGDYQAELLDGDYNPAIPRPESILGFPVGQRTATPAPIIISSI